MRFRVPFTSRPDGLEAALSIRPLPSLHGVAIRDRVVMGRRVVARLPADLLGEALDRHICSRPVDHPVTVRA